LNNKSFCVQARKKIKILNETNDETIMKLVNDNLVNENHGDIFLNGRIIHKKNFQIYLRQKKKKKNL
jgi:hypothetical protein